MPILKYVPPKQKIVDHRNADGGYYEAACENCGTIFYPERSNAKYCSPNCGLIQHRKEKAAALAAGKAIETLKKLKKAKEAVVKPESSEFRGVNQVYQYIKAVHNTHGEKEYILDSLKSMEIGEIFHYEDLEIIRLGAGKWSTK